MQRISREGHGARYHGILVISLVADGGASTIEDESRLAFVRDDRGPAQQLAGFQDLETRGQGRAATGAAHGANLAGGQLPGADDADQLADSIRGHRGLACFGRGNLAGEIRALQAPGAGFATFSRPTDGREPPGGGSTSFKIKYL